jgi:Protein of unknown function (DUF4232)
MRGKSSFVAVSIVVALAVVGSGASAAGAAGPPRCATSNLRLDFVGGQGFTSHRAWDFGLRNVGSTTCHLKGYPGVGLLDAHARPISVTVVRNTAFPVKNVVLHPWQRAYFSFVYVISGPCLPHFFSAYGLQVFPPNSAARLVYYAGRFDVCDPSVGGNPEVYPIRAKRALSAADVMGRLR